MKPVRDRSGDKFWASQVFFMDQSFRESRLSQFIFNQKNLSPAENNDLSCRKFGAEEIFR